MFFNNCSNLRILIFLQLWLLNIFQQLVLSVKNVAYRRQEINMTVTRFYTQSNQSLHAIITTETDKMQTHTRIIIITYEQHIKRDIYITYSQTRSLLTQQHHRNTSYAHFTASLSAASSPVYHSVYHTSQSVSIDAE